MSNWRQNDLGIYLNIYFTSSMVLVIPVWGDYQRLTNWLLFRWTLHSQQHGCGVISILMVGRWGLFICYSTLYFVSMTDRTVGGYQDSNRAPLGLSHGPVLLSVRKWVSWKGRPRPSTRSVRNIGRRSDMTWYHAYPPFSTRLFQFPPGLEVDNQFSL